MDRRRTIGTVRLGRPRLAISSNDRFPKPEWGCRSITVRRRSTRRRSTFIIRRSSFGSWPASYKAFGVSEAVGRAVPAAFTLFGAVCLVGLTTFARRSTSGTIQSDRVPGDAEPTLLRSDAEPRTDRIALHDRRRMGCAHVGAADRRRFHFCFACWRSRWDAFRVGRRFSSPRRSAWPRSLECRAADRCSWELALRRPPSSSFCSGTSEPFAPTAGPTCWPPFFNAPKRWDWANG